MNQTEFLYLLQHAEREIDRALMDLNHVKNYNVNIRVAVNRLYELSLEFNTRRSFLAKQLPSLDKAI